MVLSIFPIYSFIAWIYVYSAFGQLAHSDKAAQFITLFPGFIQNVNYISVLSIALALASIGLFGISNKSKDIAMLAARVVYMSFLAFILLFNIWSFL